MKEREATTLSRILGTPSKACCANCYLYEQHKDCIAEPEDYRCMHYMRNCGKNR